MNTVKVPHEARQRPSFGAAGAAHAVTDPAGTNTAGTNTAGGNTAGTGTADGEVAAKAGSDRPPHGEDHDSVPIVEYCGQRLMVNGESLVIGRKADMVIGEGNGFVHRRFLLLYRDFDRWFLNNIGTGLTASVSAVDATHHAVLGPGASLALNHERNNVRFVAGPTRYEFEVRVPCPQPIVIGAPTTGNRTIGRMPLTDDQKLLILVLAEPVLRDGPSALLSLPTSQHAAQRLGWTITKFNRKLDNVCQKLERMGVRDVHGGVGSLASNRRVRLVEHSVAAKLVTADDLIFLERAVAAAQR